MKLIFETDTHGRANIPTSRKDNFPETMLRKVKWTIDYANSIDAAIIHGGDWLNRPDTSPAFVARLAKILSKAKNPIFTVIGNHDIFGYNPTTFPRTPMYILETLGLIHRLYPGGIVYEQNGERVCLSGADAHYDIDRKPEYYLGAGIMVTDNIPKIHVVHGFLTDHEWPNVLCTTIDSILETQADVILSGHEHSGYGIIRKNGKIFCNPGALLRVTAGVGDINQEVKIAELTVENGIVDIRLVPLPLDIALPADEVLDRAKIVEEKAHNQRMASFSGNLEDVSEDIGGNTVDIMQAFLRYAGENSLEEPVIHLAASKLSMAQEMLRKNEAES